MEVETDGSIICGFPPTLHFSNVAHPANNSFSSCFHDASKYYNKQTNDITFRDYESYINKFCDILQNKNKDADSDVQQFVKYWGIYNYFEYIKTESEESTLITSEDKDKIL
jgi:hypothetical protein